MTSRTQGPILFAADTMADIQTVRQPVEQYLTRYYARKVEESGAIDASYGRLWVATERLAMASGAKRLRPYLTVLAYKAFGGSDDRSIVAVAAAQELLHTSLLIHDDIIDRDLVRHGVSNVAGQYRQFYAASGLSADDVGHYGASAALLAGDLLLSGAYELVAESGFGAEAKLRAQASLQRSVFLVAGGELLDTESTFVPQTMETARTIALLKTSSYSFEGPLVCGALLAEATDEQLALLQAVGGSLGIAYQMYDDLLSVFGGEATGKPTTSDLAEGKQTLLLQRTLAKSGPADAAYIRQVTGKGSIGPADADRVRQLMIGSGARDFVRAYAETHAAKARQQLHALWLDPRYEEYLEQFIARITGSPEQPVF